MSRMNSRIRKFFSYYKPYLGLLSADMACAVIASAAMLAIPLCVRYITANLLQVGSTDALHQIYMLLKSETITKALASEIGALLANIHLEHAEGYGDLTGPSHLSEDPRIPFTMKFEESLEECKGHLLESLLETCRLHFDRDIDLLLSADGPCVIHRDFRPGNIIAAEGKVRGIIDWSSGRGGFAEDDFCPLEFGEWPAGCKGSFLEGYASVREVPDYKPMMPLLRLSRAVAAVGFTVKRGTWESRNSKLYQFSLSYLESLAPGENV